ncbi:TPA: hypothetical protein DEP21_03895, partial [Patescibacteria group bacterium]|nr:hypothetical protein [Candidatus Gracilibacteria bacterium]
ITQKSLTHDIDENILVGNTGIDLSEEKGKLLLPVILQTSNNQDTVEVEIPEGTTFNNDSGNAYTGIIEAPEIYDISKKLDNIDTISTIKVGADESIKLTDNSGNKINATIRMPVPTNIDTGDTIIVNYSQDGEHWYHQDNVAIIEIDGKPYVSFQTDHFTIFSL